MVGGWEFAVICRGKRDTRVRVLDQIFTKMNIIFYCIFIEKQLDFNRFRLLVKLGKSTIFMQSMHA